MPKSLNDVSSGSTLSTLNDNLTVSNCYSLVFSGSTKNLNKERMNVLNCLISIYNCGRKNGESLWETIAYNCCKKTLLNIELSLGLYTTDTSSIILTILISTETSTITVVTELTSVGVLSGAVTKSVSTLEVTITDSESKSYGARHRLNTNRLIAHKSRIDTANHRKNGSWVSHVTRSIEVAVAKVATMKTILRAEHSCGHSRAVLIEPTHLVLKEHSGVVTNTLVTNRSETSSTLKKLRPVLYSLACTLTIFLRLGKASLRSSLCSTLCFSNNSHNCIKSI